MVDWNNGMTGLGLRGIVPSHDRLYSDVVDFLTEEAELLDDGRHEEWLVLLADEITYRMPIRQSVGQGHGEPFSSEGSWFDDDRYSLVKRMEHFRSSANWSEDPPSRTRRFITNVRVKRDGDEILVGSSVLLVRSRWDNREVELLSAKRNDVLKRVDDVFRLVRREIRLDQTNPDTPNLGIFL